MSESAPQSAAVVCSTPERDPMQHRWAWPIRGGMAFAVWSLLVMAGWTQGFDDTVIDFLHAPGSDEPSGPRWWYEWCRDMTALGSSGVLLVIVIASSIWLALSDRWGHMLTISLLGMGGAMAAAEVIKLATGRSRPGVGPIVDTLWTQSYPSGHAMGATAVYVVLGLILARYQKARWQRRFCVGLGLALAFIVGLTRVALGAHWPSDVLGGWLAGMTWAWTAWILAQRWE